MVATSTTNRVGSTKLGKISNLRLADQTGDAWRVFLPPSSGTGAGIGLILLKVSRVVPVQEASHPLVSVAYAVPVTRQHYRRPDLKSRARIEHDRLVVSETAARLSSSSLRPPDSAQAANAS